MAGCPSERFWSSHRLAMLVAAGAWAASIVCPLAASAEEGAKPAGNAKVTAVRFWSLGDVTRVAVEVSSDFTFKYNRLPDPERLFFDLYGASPALVGKGVHTISVSDPLLRQIRVAEKETGVTRIVLDMVQPAIVTPSQLSNPSRLVVELRPLKENSTAPAAISKVEPGRSGVPQASAGSTDEFVAIEVQPKRTRTARKFVPPVIARKNPKLPLIAAPQMNLPLLTWDLKITPLTYLKRIPALAPPTSVMASSIVPDLPKTIAVKAAAPASIREIVPPRETRETKESKPAITSRSAAPVAETVPEAVPAKRGTVMGDRSLTRALGLKLGRVVLDPGHGGHDQGTHGPSGYLEKDLCLDVALRLGALIEERLGSEVVYTRSDDTFVALEERTRIANDRKADLFLSIHANSSAYRAAAGVETYVLNFSTSKTAMDLAARENASSQKSIYDLQELLQKIAMRDKIGESLEFATRLQTSLSTLSARTNESAKNRGIKRAPFVVLIGATMPSVLSEIGFLTNPNDETLLRTPEHRQKIAESLYKGISAYADTLSRFQVAASPSRSRRTVDSKP